MYMPDSSYVAKLNAALAGQPSVVPRPHVPAPGPAAVTAPPARSESSAPASSSDSAFVSGRPAAPVVVAPARASIDAALDAASSIDAKQLALAEFEVAKNANSVKKSRASLWRTYQRLHVAWHSDNVPVLPLTATKIGAVASMFKAGRYSSYPNFIAVAKAMHLASFDEHGIHWGTELSVAVRDATRSVLRGLGSTRQSSPLDVHRVFALPLGTDPVTDDGPISPALFAVMGTFFLTREVEITCAGFAHLHFSAEREEVTWHLPVSKTDQRALGTSRTWGCVCNGNLSLACPYHAAVTQRDRLQVLANVIGKPINSLPLFPDIRGHEVTKIAAVNSIIKLAAMSGARTHDTHGRCTFGGHSLRTGGAVTLTALGLDCTKIECLGRWHSPMILHYARQAPLQSLTSEYKMRTEQSTEKFNVAQLAKTVSTLAESIERISTRLDEAQFESPQCATPLLGDIFVRNVSSDIWHLSVAHEVSANRGTCCCGWAYNEHNADLVMGDLRQKHGYMYCERCLPKAASIFNKTKRRRNSVSSCSESSEA